jgi:hypothetical protein
MSVTGIDVKKRRFVKRPISGLPTAVREVSANCHILFAIARFSISSGWAGTRSAKALQKRFILG